MKKLSDYTLDELEAELEETLGPLDYEQALVVKLIYEAYS